MLPTGVPEYRVHTKPSLVEHWRHLVEIVALVTAAVWAFYVFVYQERIKPAGESPLLQMSVDVAHEPLQGGKELVKLNVALKNIGSNDVAMAALVVNAYGVRYRSGSPTVSRETHPGVGILIVNRGLDGDKRELLYSHLVLWGPFGVPNHFTVPPGEQFVLPMPLVVDRGRYDTLHIAFARCFQRADDSGVTRYQPKRAPDGGFDILDLLSKNQAHAGLHCGGNAFNGGEYAL